MCRFQRVALYASVLLLLSAGRPALAQNAHDPNETGVALVAKDPDGIQGITAHDIFSLVDAKLGSDFGSLTMVFNDCFGEAFQDAANGTTRLKNGNVAILTATGKTDSAYAPGDLNGNAFAHGFSQKLTEDPKATIAQAFDGGKKGIDYLVGNLIDHYSTNHPDIKIAKTSPASTYFGKGEEIVLGGEAKRKMAILFVGKPENFADWTDLQRQFQALIDMGWKGQDIAIFFGETPDGNRDGPVISANLTVMTNATANNKEVKFTYTDPVDPRREKDMPIWHKATYANLTAEIAKMHAYGTLPENKPMELFIWFGGHDTSIDLKNRPEPTTTEQKSSTAEQKSSTTPGGGRGGSSSTPRRKRGRIAASNPAAVNFLYAVATGLYTDEGGAPPPTMTLDSDNSYETSNDGPDDASPGPLPQASADQGRQPKSTTTQGGGSSTSMAASFGEGVDDFINLMFAAAYGLDYRGGVAPPVMTLDTSDPLTSTDQGVRTSDSGTAAPAAVGNQPIAGAGTALPAYEFGPATLTQSFGYTVGPGGWGSAWHSDEPVTDVVPVVGDLGGPVDNEWTGDWSTSANTSSSAFQPATPDGHQPPTPDGPMPGYGLPANTVVPVRARGGVSDADPVPLAGDTQHPFNQTIGDLQYGKVYDEYEDDWVYGYFTVEVSPYGLRGHRYDEDDDTYYSGHFVPVAIVPMSVFSKSLGEMIEQDHLTGTTEQIPNTLINRTIGDPNSSTWVPGSSWQPGYPNLQRDWYTNPVWQQQVIDRTVSGLLTTGDDHVPQELITHYDYMAGMVGTKTSWQPVKDLTFSAEFLYSRLIPNINGQYGVDRPFIGGDQRTGYSDLLRYSDIPRYSDLPRTPDTPAATGPSAHLGDTPSGAGSTMRDKALLDEATKPASATASRVERDKALLDEATKPASTTTSRVERDKALLDEATKPGSTTTSRVERDRALLDEAAKHPDEATKLRDQTTKLRDETPKSRANTINRVEREESITPHRSEERRSVVNPIPKSAPSTSSLESRGPRSFSPTGGGTPSHETFGPTGGMGGMTGHGGGGMSGGGMGGGGMGGGMQRR